MALYEDLMSQLQNIPNMPINIGAASPEADYPDIRGLFTPGFEAGRIKDVAGALAQESATEVNYKEKMADYNRRLQMQQLEKRMGKATGRGFQRVPKEDGGFDFFDDEGNPITIEEYSVVTGKTKESVLKASTNPQDIRFVADMRQVREIVNKLQDRDVEYFTKLEAKLRAQNVDPASIVPANLIQALLDTYPQYFSAEDNEAFYGNEEWRKKILQKAAPVARPEMEYETGYAQPQYYSEEESSPVTYESAGY